MKYLIIGILKSKSIDELTMDQELANEAYRNHEITKAEKIKIDKIIKSKKKYLEER